MWGRQDLHNFTTKFTVGFQNRGPKKLLAAGQGPRVTRLTDKRIRTLAYRLMAREAYQNLTRWIVNVLSVASARPPGRSLSRTSWFNCRWVRRHIWVTCRDRIHRNPGRDEKDARKFDEVPIRGYSDSLWPSGHDGTQTRTSN